MEHSVCEDKRMEHSQLSVRRKQWNILSVRREQWNILSVRREQWWNILNCNGENNGTFSAVLEERTMEHSQLSSRREQWNILNQLGHARSWNRKPHWAQYGPGVYLNELCHGGSRDQKTGWKAGLSADSNTWTHPVLGVHVVGHLLQLPTAG